MTKNVKAPSTHSKAGATHVDTPPVNAKETPISAKMGTHVNTPPILAKAGFTLAEVLITLGIIGVVAAMTIPTLMTKFQWIQLHSQFRHAYATVSNAFQLLTNDEEQEVPLCYYSTTGNHHWEGCVAFYEALSKKMKTMAVCSRNAYEKGCIPKYKGQEEVREIKDEDMPMFDSSCIGYKSTNILKYAPTYTLIDGTIIIPYTIAAENHMGPLFLIDINGQKGPNKWGYDLHGFSIYEAVNGSLYITADRNCTYLEKGGKSNKQMMRQTR